MYGRARNCAAGARSARRFECMDRFAGHEAVEDSWAKIHAVRPDEHPRISLDRPKAVHVRQRAEEPAGARNAAFQVQFAGDAVVEAQLEAITLNVAEFCGAGGGRQQGALRQSLRGS